MMYTRVCMFIKLRANSRQAKESEPETDITGFFFTFFPHSCLLGDRQYGTKRPARKMFYIRNWQLEQFEVVFFSPCMNHIKAEA